MSESERVRRFVLEKHPIRGHAVRLARTWLALREHQEALQAALSSARVRLDALRLVMCLP